MSEGTADKKVEVQVGRRVAGEDAPFIGEIIRFKGKKFGTYTADRSISDNKRKDVVYALYRCPDG